MATPMLELKDLVKVFNAGTQDEKRAMDSVNFTVEKGEDNLAQSHCRHLSAR